MIAALFRDEAAEKIDVDGRIDDVGIAPVTAPDTVGNVAGDGEKARDLAAARDIPGAQSVEDAICQRAPPPTGGAGRGEVGFAQVPGVTHRREAITQVELIGSGARSLGHGM